MSRITPSTDGLAVVRTSPAVAFVLGPALALVVIATAPESVLAQAGARRDALVRPDEPRDAVTADTPEALRAHLDSLRPLLAEARRDLDARNARITEARRAAAAAAARIDTLLVGGVGLRVLTPASQSQATRELFEEVWDETFADLGHSPSLGRSTVTFQRKFGSGTPIHVDGQAQSISVDPWSSRERTKAEVRRLLSSLMVHDLRPARNRVGIWLRSDPLSPAPLRDIYRRIAVTRSKVTRECLAGDVEACGSAMALDVTQDFDQLGEWYTAEERRGLVVDRLGFFRGPYAALRRRCVDQADQSACDELLGLLSGSGVGQWAPLGPDVRESLVAYALEVAPPGSWERLVEDPGMTPREALEHASGQPVDVLLAGWRDRLLASRPSAFGPLIPSSGRTLAWTLLFAALALRSTRWRLG